MTNREKHLDEILAVQHWGNFNGEIRRCGNCPECDFNDGSNTFPCKNARLVWLQAEADEEPEVDWNKVPVDTPIYVRDFKCGGGGRDILRNLKTGKCLRGITERQAGVPTATRHAGTTQNWQRRTSDDEHSISNNIRGHYRVYAGGRKVWRLKQMRHRHEGQVAHIKNQLQYRPIREV